MTNEKITNRKALEIAIEMVDREDVKEKLQKMIESLDKKSAKKVEERNSKAVEFAETVYCVLDNQPQKLFTATDIARVLEFEYSVQKVTSALTLLVKEGKVSKTKDKKSSVYQKAE